MSASTRSEARPDAGGVEVRLLRRLSVEPARLRRRAAGARRARYASRTSPRCRGRRSKGPTTSRWWRDRSRPPTTSSGSRRCARTHAIWSRSARARRPGGSRRCATSSSRGVRGHRLRPSRVPANPSTTSTPISAHVRGRLRAARLSHRPRPTARGAARLPRRSSSGHRRALRLPGVQGSRRPSACLVAHATAVPGPGDPRGLRRALSLDRSRLLRLLRTEPRARTRRPWSRQLSRHWARPTTTCGCFTPSTPPRPAFREAAALRHR